MNNEKSQKIVSRYFQAVTKLVEKGKYKTYYEFAQVHEIDKHTFYNSMRDPASNRFQIEWISSLSTKDGISLEWLILNKGAMKKSISKQLSLSNK